MTPLPVEAILRIARAHGARDVRVFGSRAREDSRPDSDLDLLVRFEEGRSLVDLVSMKLALEELLGIPVDVVSEPGLSRYIRIACWRTPRRWRHERTYRPRSSLLGSGLRGREGR